MTANYSGSEESFDGAKLWALKKRMSLQRNRPRVKSWSIFFSGGYQQEVTTVYSSTNKKRGLPARGVRYLLILLVLMSLLAPTAYAQSLAPQEGEDPPTYTVAGTTAAVLPVTGQSILWIVIVGAVLLCGGVFLFLRTRKTHGL
jgi:LPXTG-motif cell wall-anchored protein